MYIVVPDGFREKVLRLAHEILIMSGHLFLEFVVIWLDFVHFVNHVAFAKGLFRTVVPLRYLWENYPGLTQACWVDIVGPI